MSTKTVLVLLDVKIAHDLKHAGQTSMQFCTSM